MFARIVSSTRAAVEFFFQHAAGDLHVPDPAGHSGDMAAPLARNQEQNIRQSFSTALTQVRRALDAERQGNTLEALRQWRIVFAQEFPSYTFLTS